MAPELGIFAIILAWCFSGIQIFLPRVASYSLTKTIVMGQCGFLLFAMGCLVFSFIYNDLTVIYVREHSHALLPLFYRMGAAWGGHEGSLLLWCIILSGWTAAFVFFSRSLSQTSFFYRVVMILGIVSFGFIAFLLFTSNPFQRNFPTQLITGDDLTPVLQDPGLIFHPPMLYLGYVGFVIGFAFAVSALLSGKIEDTWARQCRPWIILPWGFLSCGIVLGSWWAYRELGWGGWWFWDPVENASLLPWLSATALIHSLIVSEKRKAFFGWTVLLAIVTFSLSLIGTFLVRSGVLVSVHAFANDPTRGLFLLAYLTFIVGGAFLLYAYRIKHFYRPPTFQLFSRETFLLMNSVMLLVVSATILLGTLYPIILDAMNLGKISVGEPYFNTIFIPIMLVLLLLMGIAPHVSWEHTSISDLYKKLRIPIVLSAIMGFLIPTLFGYPFYFLTGLGITLSVWIVLSTFQFIFLLSSKKKIIKSISMIIAHLGIAVLAFGIVMNKSYSEEKQIKISPGERVTLAGYQFFFKDMREMNQANYQSLVAVIEVSKNKKCITELFPEQRVYRSHQDFLSKPAVTYNVWRDLYVALGSSLSDKAWSMRLYYKPFVRWIWAGGVMLLIGGLLSFFSHRREYL